MEFFVVLCYICTFNINFKLFFKEGVLEFFGRRFALILKTKESKLLYQEVKFREFS